MITLHINEQVSKSTIKIYEYICTHLLTLVSKLIVV